VDHLVHAVSQPEELAAVQGGGVARLHRPGIARRATENGIFVGSGRCHLASQRFGQLIQNKRYPVLQIGFARRRRGPLGNLEPATPDQVVAVRAHEFMQHRAARPESSFPISSTWLSPSGTFSEIADARSVR
jgi:hypothetical protein